MENIKIAEILIKVFNIDYIDNNDDVYNIGFMDGVNHVRNILYEFPMEIFEEINKQLDKN